MTSFPIHRIDRNRAEQFEQLGSKPKFWFRDGERRVLFKADDRGTGEDWAEVVASHLCNLLGLPHVEYELAAEYDGGNFLRPGVICETMAPPPSRLVLGNEFLLVLDPGYPALQRFKVRQHTVDAVVSILDSLPGPAERWATDLPAGISTALDSFVGYTLLDVWIANQDRHHENWGAIVDDFLTLAPTFDHGSGLARNLNDSERKERLSTRDRNRSVAVFARKAQSTFYRTEADVRPLSTLDAFLSFGEVATNAKYAWLERLSDVRQEQLWDILEQVPLDRMSPICKDFTLELLLENQRRLLDQGNL